MGHEDVKIIPTPTPRDVLALVQAVMSESLVRAVGAVYEFNLSGENGGIFYLDLKNGKKPVLVMFKSYLIIITIITFHKL